MTQPAGSNLAMKEADLAELMRAFNEVTQRLQTTHETLRAEVSRLSRELSEANEQLERSRRLASLGEVAAGIAHEVRNPLGSIRLYAKMLVDDLPDRPKQQATAGKIAEAARALEAVVGDVLTFSKEIRLRSQTCVAGEAFAQAMESAIPGGPASLCNVTISVVGASDTVFEADPGLLQQVLVNVIRNALEAMADAPRTRHQLLLSTEQRMVANREGRAQRSVVLEVTDTGSGIPSEVVSRMFNPFFTTRASGTGLGLAIVHRIVDAHGGRIVVRNNTVGATIQIVLPVEMACPAAEPGDENMKDSIAVASGRSGFRALEIQG